MRWRRLLAVRYSRDNCLDQGSELPSSTMIPQMMAAVADV